MLKLKMCLSSSYSVLRIHPATACWLQKSSEASTRRLATGPGIGSPTNMLLRTSFRPFRHVMRATSGSRGGAGGGNSGNGRSTSYGEDGGSAGRPSYSLPSWFVFLGAALIAAGVTAAAAPFILSSPLALKVLLAAANAAVSARIEADRLEVDGWLGGSGSVNLYSLRITELEAVGGQQLMWVPHMAMQGTLWRALLLQGTPSSPVHIVLKEPDINGAYDANVRDFRLNRFLEEAGVLAPPPPTPSTTPAAVLDTVESVAEMTGAAAEAVGTAAEAAADAAIQPSGQAGAELGAQRLRGRQAPEQQAEQLSSLEPVGRYEKQQQLHQQQQGRRRHKEKEQQQQQQEQDQGRVDQQAAEHGGQPPGTKGTPPALAQQQRADTEKEVGGSLRTLVETNSHVALWGELLKPELTLHVLNGKLRVNDEVRNILGGQLVLKGAFGDRHLSQQHVQQHKLQQQVLRQRPAGPAQQRAQQLLQGKAQLQPLWQVHITQQPRLDHAPPELPNKPAEQPACVSNGASISDKSTDGSSNSSSTGDGSSRGASVAAAAADGAKQAHKWWTAPPENRDASKRLAEAIDANGKEQCVAGEWQVLTPNLQIQMRVWEVNGFKTLPLKSRKLLEGHERHQREQAQSQTQQQQQAQLRLQGKDAYSTQQQQRRRQEHLRLEGKEVAHADMEKAPNLADLPPKFTLLHEPASMSLRFSHALARTGFPVVAPILGQVTSLAEGSCDTIAATFTPDGMTLPYKSASVHMGPLRVKLAASPVLNKLILALKGLPQGTMATSTQAISFLTGDPMEGTRNRASPEMGLEAWMSGMHMRMERSGTIEQRRLDLLIGPMGSLPSPSAIEDKQAAAGARAAAAAHDGNGQADDASGHEGHAAHIGPVGSASEAEEGTSEPGQGGHASPKGSQGKHRVVHLVLWGAMDPATDQVSMTLGVAGSTLEHLLGLKNLPAGYCLPLSLKGTAKAPVLELSDLSKRLARLAILRVVQRTMPAGAAGWQEDSNMGKRGTEEEGKAWVPASHQQRALHAVQDQQRVEEQGGWRQEVEGGAGEPSGKGKGLRGRVKAVGSWVLRAVLHLVVPGESGLEEVERQVAAEAAQIPAQECDVPWLRGPDEKTRPHQ